MGFFKKILEKTDRFIDNNKWARIASTALGGEVWRTGIRQAQDKNISDWNSDDYRTIANSVSAYRQYKDQERQAGRAAGLDERMAQNRAQSGEDALVSQINRAYGVEGDEGDELMAAIAQWENELRAKVDAPGYKVYGAERDAAVRNLAEMQRMRQEIEESRVGTSATLARGAIDTMAKRTGNAAKRSATRELDTRLAATVTKNQARAYTRGTQGASFDKAAQANTIAGYTKGRAGIQNAVSAGDRTFRTEIDKQRQTLVDRARSGATKTLDEQATMVDQRTAADSAFANMTERSLGNVLATGSDLALNDVLERRKGNVGWAGVNPRTPTTSRSTFGSIR